MQFIRDNGINYWPTPAERIFLIDNDINLTSAT